MLTLCQNQFGSSRIHVSLGNFKLDSFRVIVLGRASQLKLISLFLLGVKR